MQAIFRCDASLGIGGGHVMRCITLADHLSSNGWECAFSCNGEAISVVPALKKYKSITPEDLGQKADLLVVDHYGLDHNFESKARAWAKRILVIDDLADRKHNCDILLDQTYGRDANDYKTLVPPNCTILTGAKYALLRPQFSAARAQSLERRNAQNFKLQRVLISLGMTNMFNITLKALRGVQLFNETPLQIDVILGEEASFIDEIKAQISLMNKADFHNARLHSNVSDMAAVMSAADLAIGAGGTTSWERCCLGLPTIVIELADNQKKITAELAENGAITNMGWHEDVSAKNLAKKLSSLYLNPNIIKNISQNSINICDGRGAERLLPWLLPAIISNDSKEVRLRFMNEQDDNILLEWQKHPKTRKFFRNNIAPSKKSHKMWVKRKLLDKNCKPYIILHDKIPAGLIRLDKIDKKNNITIFEVSILISPNHYKKGLGFTALNIIRQIDYTSNFRAEIYLDNVASIKLFKKAGYKHFVNDWYHQKGCHNYV